MAWHKRADDEREVAVGRKRARRVRRRIRRSPAGWRFEQLEPRILLSSGPAATVTLDTSSIVHPHEGFGFGSTIEGLGQAINLDATSSLILKLNEPFGVAATG